MLPTLQAELDRHKIDHKLDVWPGTHHGFSFPARDIYDETAAEGSWTFFFEMCERRLKGVGKQAAAD